MINRAQRRRRIAEGLCVYCGQPAELRPNQRATLCQPCRASWRQRQRISAFRSLHSTTVRDSSLSYAQRANSNKDKRRARRHLDAYADVLGECRRQKARRVVDALPRSAWVAYDIVVTSALKLAGLRDDDGFGSAGRGLPR